MPELPEVETIKKDLQSKVLNKKIKEVKVGKPKIARPGVKKLRKKLIENSFVEINRRGKLLYVKLKKESLYLLIHLKMTGQLIYRNKKEIIAGGHSDSDIDLNLPNKYSHIIITFDDDSCLFFNDMRQFGYMDLVDEDRLLITLSRFGIEPLLDNFTLKSLKKIIKKRKTSIKAVLLNQQLIAGIGNIYADEILFESGVMPDRESDSLNDKEIEKIHLSSVKIIKKAVKNRGTTFNNYVDAEGRKGNFLKHLNVYQREGQKCRKCKKGIIKKTKVAGRGTRFCEVCQK